jgi:hypothetical protein
MTASIKVNGYIQAPSETDYDKKKFEFSLDRKPRNPATCTSLGDPHFKTFDGRKYSYYGAGLHYLVKSDRLDVQAEHYACHPKMYCNSNVAIRHYGGIFLFSLDGTTGQTKLELYGDVGGIKTTKISDEVR